MTKNEWLERVNSEDNGTHISIVDGKIKCTSSMSEQTNDNKNILKRLIYIFVVEIKDFLKSKWKQLGLKDV